MNPSKTCGEKGSALVICLAVIVLLLAMTMAFLAKSQTLRTIESSGAGRVRSEIMARSALEYTLGLLAKEITDPVASEAWGDGPERVFRPKNATNMVPKVQIKPALNSSRAVHMPSILKQSIVALDPLASTHRSGDPNGQGRSVEPARWNDPWFYFSSPQFVLPNRAPDWIYFDDEGATPSASPSVQGRAAFNIYQIDNLLDLSVAGYPAALQNDIPAVNALKGSLAGADLTRLGSLVPVLNDPENKYVDVRSRGSSRQGTYVENVRADSNGFLEPPPGDTQFVSRLDLLRFSRSIGLNNNPLAYLSAWSRALDAPSWHPAVPTAANVFAPAVLRRNDAVITDFLLDGSTRTRPVRSGQAVAARRFPLSRLGWFEAGDQPHRAAAIRQYFGLEKTPEGIWRYTDPSIKTLTELAGEDREPHFFEMLKAAIVSGSLGSAQTGADAALTAQRDADKDLHVLRIGAAIIDAAGEGNQPLTLALSSGGTLRYVYGIKDLPYLYAVRFRQIITTDPEGNIQQIDHLALPVLVNPHALAAQPQTRPMVRIRLVGAVTQPEAEIAGSTFALTSRFPVPGEGANAADRVIGFDPHSFRAPGPITAWTPSSPALPAQAQAPMPASFAGSSRAFWLASGTAPGTIGTALGRAELRGFNLVLEYWDGANWLPYDALVGDGRNDPVDGLGSLVPVELASNETVCPAPADAQLAGPGTVYFLKPDPRTTRWGIARGKTALAPADPILQNRIPSEPADSYAVPLAPAGVFPAVADPDSMTRETDLQMGSGLPANGVKMMKHVLSNLFSETQVGRASEERNVIVRRPFATVGELGSVFRDQPWKTLNFATTNSGDAALLDYFCINESGPEALVAGRINLNTQSPPDTLDNQLAKTSIQIGGSIPLLTSEVEALRDAIVTATRTTPFQSPAGLVGVPALAKLPANLRASKQRRETAVRALGTAGQTRTWNFFIDLIAQTGALVPPASSDLGKDFVVQGEYRFWMHVAIDRFTGRIVDSHLEAYQE